MSGTITLTEFIKARLDEDEATARAAEPNMVGQEWRSVSHYGDGGQVERAAYPHDVVVYDEGSPSVEQAGHIARHDPSRVLNQVDAHRMLVEDHSGHHVCEDNMAGTVWDEKTEDIVEDPYRVLRIIGSIYADHPDYRTEWQVQP